MTSQRIKSIDIFRGLTIFVMIFVNDLASVKDIPMWLKHYPGDANGMTFVDVVFPAFLFIVGMSIPFAIQNRLNKGITNLNILLHIFIRALGLILIGVCMVNIHALDSQATGMSKSVWMLLLFIAVILGWNRYPNDNQKLKYLFLFLKILGFLLILFLLVIYRGNYDNQITWIKTSWWGILGLIGWAYLISASIYLLCRKNIFSMIGFLVIFILSYIADKNGQFIILNPLTDYIWLGGHIGGHSALVTAGIITSILLRNDFLKFSSFIQLYFWLFSFAIFSFISGIFLYPLFGINKNLATPAWVLFCISICLICYMFLHWISDIKDKSKYFNFIEPVGTNPLLAYIFPDIIYALIGIFNLSFYDQLFGRGMIGIIRSIIFTIIMVYLTKLFTKLRIRLQL